MFSVVLFGGSPLGLLELLVIGFVGLFVIVFLVVFFVKVSLWILEKQKH